MCKIAQKLLNTKVEQINFFDIDYKNMFDGIFACASLLHLLNEDLIICLNKICSSLKQNGILYVSFKYGCEERTEDGRFFNDMTEEKFNNMCKNIPRFKNLRCWITDAYKSNKKFIDFIIRKM